MDQPNTTTSGKIRLTSRVLDFESAQKWVIESRKLGQGSYAKVYWGYQKGNKQNTVAIKVIHKKKLQLYNDQMDTPLSKITNNKLVESLNVEIKFLKSAHHINIVRLFDVLESPTRFFLVYEYCDLDLKRFIFQKHVSGNGLAEWEIQAILRQMANGLRFMRSRNLIHRDLKPQNILLKIRSSTASTSNPSSSPSAGSSSSSVSDFIDDGRFPYILKIADFGFVRDMMPAEMSNTVCGTPKYMAPEILNGSKYDIKADLWSVGVILLEMITGTNPFEQERAIDFHRKHQHHYPTRGSEIISNLISNFWKPHYPPNALDLIKKLMQPDPSNRIDWDGFFQHPFMTIPSMPPSSPPPSEQQQQSQSPEYQRPIPVHSQPAETEPQQNERMQVMFSNNVVPAVISLPVQFQQDDLPCPDEDEQDFIILPPKINVWENSGYTLWADTSVVEYQINEAGQYEIQVHNLQTWRLYFNAFSVQLILDGNKTIQQQQQQQQKPEEEQQRPTMEISTSVSDESDSVCADSSNLIDTLRANSCFSAEFQLLPEQLPCRMQIRLRGGWIPSQFLIRLLSNSASPQATPISMPTTEERESHFV